MGVGLNYYAQPGGNLQIDPPHTLNNTILTRNIATWGPILTYIKTFCSNRLDLKLGAAMSTFIGHRTDTLFRTLKSALGTIGACLGAIGPNRACWSL